MRDTPPGTISDVQVVARVLQGDIASFELIMRRYNRRLYRVARGILADDAAAEDVVQETYLKAYSNLSTFKNKAAFATWLTRIAVYEALALKRKRKQSEPFPDHHQHEVDMRMHHPDQDPAVKVSNQELGRILVDTIDGLDEDLRVVFVMRMVEELDTRETSECLGISESNVKVRLHRARTILRERIDQQIGADTRHLFQFDGQRCDRIVDAVLGRLLK